MHGSSWHFSIFINFFVLDRLLKVSCRVDGHGPGIVPWSYPFSRFGVVLAPTCSETELSACQSQDMPGPRSIKLQCGTTPIFWMTSQGGPDTVSKQGKLTWKKWSQISKCSVTNKRGNMWKSKNPAVDSINCDVLRNGLLFLRHDLSLVGFKAAWSGIEMLSNFDCHQQLHHGPHYTHGDVTKKI